MLKTWLYSIAGLTLFLLLSYGLILYALPVLLPFVLALILAELIDPAVNLLSSRGRFPRTLSVAVVLLVVVGLSGFAITAAVGRLIYEAQQAYAQLPYLYALGLDYTEVIAGQFRAFEATLPDVVHSLLVRNLTALQSWLSDGLGPLVTTLGYVRHLPMFLVNLLFFLIATFFISRDRSQIGAFLLSLFPLGWREQIASVRVTVWASAIGFAKAQLLLILMTMVQTIVGLAIIGSPYAVLLGIIVGVADILPLLGPGTILLPWALFSMATGNLWFGVKLGLLYIIVVSVRQTLEAKVTGDRMGLHPLAILFSFYIGFHFFGPIGFLMGPLLAILLKALIQSGLLPIFRDAPVK